MKKALITLVVVLGLFVAADFGAAAVAEYQVSKQMRQQLRLEEDPAVRINGFPFLWQAAWGDYRNVELEARAVEVGELSEVGVGANLHHAKVATSEVIAGTADEIDVEEVVGRVELKASDVGRYLNITDLRISPAPKNALQEESSGDDASGQPQNPSGADPTSSGQEDGGDRTKATVQLDGSVNIGGENVKVKVIAVLSLLNGKLEIEPRKLDLNTSRFGDIPLPAVFEKSVLQQFNTTLDPGALPFRVVPTAVDVEHGALIVEGKARDVTISAGGMSSP
ncbi:DUF2993 domain-containing protein [Allosaccharopolyspora coralli]|uniref:DUF2993 domain-containing protein n=1 Tax=Allosaccharopolyspora coralli TaxID=2665642 RepID=A0A5Q3QJX9_9PSEU|nr:DUF2993 domain-containing protein [Allosaccharopolyspora coralli]QGK71749.1 DUF2993 domain-containing protein [Allosaccharopolyspora coralli]